MLAAEPIKFRMAGLKLLPVQWDKAANFEKLELWARRAATGGADLIMTVEGYLEGYVGNEKFTEGLTREATVQSESRLMGSGFRRPGNWQLNWRFISYWGLPSGAVRRCTNRLS